MALHKRLFFILFGHHRRLLSICLLCYSLVLIMENGVQGWSQEGHVMTCQIAQERYAAVIFLSDALKLGKINIPANFCLANSSNMALLISLMSDKFREKILYSCIMYADQTSKHQTHAVKKLLPEYAHGNLSSLCVWADQIRHWYKYRWTSALHFIDTPDQACNFDYSRDCHDPKGVKDMCVAGAISNYTTQLSHYKEGTSDQQYNMTEALLFLSHFTGDIHQPLHVGFTSDEGGNTIELHWYGHKSNLHHVWDREIILTAAKDFYEEDMSLLEDDIVRNFTNGIWHDDVASWKECNDVHACVNKWAGESITAACKWGYKDVKSGITLKDEYFNSRLPIVMKRIAQGGVRLAMILNRVFGKADRNMIATA